MTAFADPASLLALCSALPLANDRLEAGFFFEEGGCWGFALALHQHLQAQGFSPQIVYQTGWMHAFVLVDKTYIDYRGAGVPSDLSLLKSVTPTELMRVAVEEAFHLECEVESAKEFALQTIALAIELQAEVSETEPA